MSIAWHPTRWWDWYLSEDEKTTEQKAKPTFADKN